MVLPVNTMEVYIPVTGVAERTTAVLNVLFAILIVLSIGHLCYGDFWGFVLDSLFGLLGFITFKRMQLSTVAFFCFLCGFNAGIDLIASINLVSTVLHSNPDELYSLGETLHMQVWQVVTATIVLTLDAIIMITCLFLSCKVYNELRSTLYSQIGLITEPLMLATNNHHEQQAPPFQPFQGTPHRIATPP